MAYTYPVLLFRQEYRMDIRGYCVYNPATGRVECSVQVTELGPGISNTYERRAEITVQPARLELPDEIFDAMRTLAATLIALGREDVHLRFSTQIETRQQIQQQKQVQPVYPVYLPGF